ncbi:MAG: exo-beta-N-acetylmuramidase NamZ domain-containing protein, partial [Bacteroidota bacterium]
MKKIFFFLLCASLIVAKPAKKLKTGADVLFESRTELIKGKKIGLITNHTAKLSNGKHLADALHEFAGATLVVLFGPEHGVRGDAPDGRTVRDTTDEKTGVPVYSLYGKVNK